MKLVFTCIMIIYFILTGIIYLRLADIIRRKERLIRIAEIRMKNQEKLIDKMAEDLATDYHSKEWIINHYLWE